MLPMLLMSNLLQWEGVTSASIHHIEDDYGEAYLKDLFDQAIKLSNDTMALTIEMRMIFVSISLISDSANDSSIFQNRSSIFLTIQVS
jgi:hypothetical protein